MDIIIYHKSDLDGIGSAAIFYQDYPEAEYIGLEHGKEKDDFDLERLRDKTVAIVDFSFDVMEGIKNICKELIWIDHHESAKKQNLKIWNDEKVKGLRSIEHSAIHLVWKYLNPEEEIPIIVNLIEDGDLWTWQYKKASEPFTTAFMSIDPEYSSKKWTTLLLDDTDYLDELIEKGKGMIEVRMKRIKRLYKYGNDITWEGNKCRIINSTSDCSHLGQHCYDNGYDIGMIWKLIGNEVVIGLRSNKVDVSALAKKHGGGGHKFASGFSCTMQELGIMLK